MKIKTFALSLPFCLFAVSSQAALTVVTTTTDLASLAEEIGGKNVTVTSIAKGYQDPHFVEAKPSYLLKLRKADLFIQAGLELEVAWAPSLFTNARNSKILPGSSGFLDASEGCEILQKTLGRVDRSAGDVHPLGNPHYWLDPENGKIIARNITKKLSELDPLHQSDYQANLEKFKHRIDQKLAEWKKVTAPLQGLKIVTYHNSWPNFAKRFGLNIVNYIEPKPGIPASPAHVHSLIDQIKRENIPLILIEPYFDAKLPEKIAHETGATLLIFPPSVGSVKGIESYFDLFDHDIGLLNSAVHK